MLPVQFLWFLNPFRSIVVAYNLQILWLFQTKLLYLLAILKIENFTRRAIIVFFSYDMDIFVRLESRC